MFGIVGEVAWALPVDPDPVQQVDVSLVVHHRVRVRVHLHVGEEFRRPPRGRGVRE